MKQHVIQEIVLGAIRNGNLSLAAKSCHRLAREMDNDPDLLAMSAQLAEQIPSPEEAARYHALAAAEYARRNKADKMKREFECFAKYVNEEERERLCCTCFHACRDHTKPCATQGASLCRLFREHPIWSQQDASLIPPLLHGSRIQRHRAGEIIVQQGEASHCVYLVLEGEIQEHNPCTCEKASCAARLSPSRPGDICAALAFHLNLGRHFYRISVLRDSRLLAIPHGLLRRLMQHHEGFRAWMESRFHLRARERLLHNISFFSRLRDGDILDIAKSLRNQHVAPGEFVFRQGESTRQGMFILQSGWIAIDYQWHGANHTLCMLKAGDSFGELGILQNVRQVSARSVSHTQLLAWPESHFRQAYEKFYSIRDHSKASFRRYRQNMEAVHQHARSPLSNPLTMIDHDKLLQGMSCCSSFVQGT